MASMAAMRCSLSWKVKVVSVFTALHQNHRLMHLMSSLDPAKLPSFGSNHEQFGTPGGAPEARDKLKHPIYTKNGLQNMPFMPFLCTSKRSPSKGTASIGAASAS